MKNKAQVWIGVVLTLLILGACQSASLEKKDVWVKYNGFNRCN